MKLKCIFFTLMALLAFSPINAKTLLPPTPDGESGSGGGLKSISKPTISAVMNDTESIDIYFRTAKSKIEVSITNDFGEVVYKDKINTSSRMSLHIDISTLPTDRYTIRCYNVRTGELTQFVFEIK